MVNGLDEGWMRDSSIMDSGAAESVAPPTTCPHIPLTESPGSRTGQECRTAGGERLRNQGQILADDTRSHMPPTDSRRHRSAVALVVYMAHDRPDLDVVACTLAKTMAHPMSGDGWLVKRVCRYIKGRPRYAQY